MTDESSTHHGSTSEPAAPASRPAPEGPPDLRAIHALIQWRALPAGGCESCGARTRRERCLISFYLAESAMPSGLDAQPLGTPEAERQAHEHFRETARRQRAGDFRIESTRRFCVPCTGGMVASITAHSEMLMRDRLGLRFIARTYPGECSLFVMRQDAQGRYGVEHERAPASRWLLDLARAARRAARGA